MLNLRVLLFVLIALITTAPASAAPTVWYLNGVTMQDGGTATGTITYDPSADNRLVAWSISVSGGQSSVFTPVTFTNTLSGSFGGNLNLEWSDVLFTNPPASVYTGPLPSPNPSDRRRILRLTLQAPIGSAPTVSVTTGYDCFDCSPYRLITTGSIASSLAQSDWVLPLASPTVTQDFNCYACYKSDKFHTGMDLVSADGSVVAVGAGELYKVYRTNDKGNLWCEGGSDRLTELPLDTADFGNTVILSHVRSTGETVFSQYSHLRCLSKALGLIAISGLAEGDAGRKVVRGASIGVMGQSDATNVIGKWPVHLHFEVKRFGTPKSPSNSDRRTGTRYAGYTPDSALLFNYLDPVDQLFSGQIDASSSWLLTTLDPTTAFEAPGPDINSADPLKNTMSANALLFADRKARMSDGNWYRVSMGMPPDVVDVNIALSGGRTVKKLDNNSPEGWIHEKHVVEYYGFTVTVPTPEGVVHDVYDKPQGKVVARVLGGQSFQRVGATVPGSARGNVPCVTNWVQIHLGVVNKDDRTTISRGWICQTPP